MNMSTLLIGLAVLTTLAGCKPTSDQHSAAEPGVASSPETRSSPTHVSTPSIGKLIDIPAAADGGAPTLLSAGNSLNGTFTIPQSGDVQAMGLQIGNYGGSANGTAMLELCLSAGVCEHGTASILGSLDNNYLQFQLTAPLAVTAGSTLTYTFTRIDGDKPFAIWTYPSSTQGEITLPDGKKVPRSAKAAITF